MNLKRRVTLSEIESEHPYVLDESHFMASHDEWLAVRDEWRTFSGLVQNGDVLWEYEDVDVHMGFVAGCGGFLIRRGDETVGTFVTYVVG